MQNTYMEKDKVRRSDLSTNSSTVHMDLMPNEECQDFDTKIAMETNEAKFLDDGRIKPKLLEYSRVSRSTPDPTSQLNRGSASRIPGSTEKEQTQNSWLTGYSNMELKCMQEKDPDIGIILNWKINGNRPYGTTVTASSPETRHYWNYWSSLEIVQGVLCKKFHTQDGNSTYLQFIVPHTLRQEIMYSMHNGLLSGHLGRKKTTDKILQRFYWFGLRDDVNIWIKRCDTCAANKKPKRKPRAPMGDMRVGAPLDRLSIDVLGPLPKTSRGNQYILVVADAFTKWTEAYAIPNQTAKTCAHKILNEFIG